MLFHLQILPREMMEMILLKSMAGIMSVEWMANVLDNESVSGSYKLYDTVANKTLMSAYVRMKSVTYQWMHARYLNRGVALKRCEFYLISQHTSSWQITAMTEYNTRTAVLKWHAKRFYVARHVLEIYQEIMVES